jgi:hypothetical protein
MEWRIRESSYGGYVAERGISHEGGALAPSGIGYTMPAFIVYESRRFDTLAQAKRYIKKNS